MARRILTLILAAATCLLAAPAYSDVNAGHGGFDVSAQTTYSHGAPSATTSVPGVATHTVLTACEGDGACPAFTCPDGEVRVYYETATVAGETPVANGPMCLGGRSVTLTQADVMRAFRRIPVPTPVLHIQPVKGTTLVNLKTNFYAGGPTRFTRTVTLLGQRVTLRIRVDHYLFRFGDGQQLTTSEPGAAYPRLINTHVYLRKGLVRPRLATTWAADYRVASGSWRTVDGTVTRTGPAQELQVITATPVLTGS